MVADDAVLSLEEVKDAIDDEVKLKIEEDKNVVEAPAVLNLEEVEVETVVLDDETLLEVVAGFVKEQVIGT